MCKMYVEKFLYQEDQRNGAVTGGEFYIHKGFLSFFLFKMQAIRVNLHVSEEDPVEKEKSMMQ